MGVGPEEAEGTGRGVRVRGAAGRGAQACLGAGRRAQSPRGLQKAGSVPAACVTRPDSDLDRQMINVLLFSPSAWPAQQGIPRSEFSNRRCSPFQRLRSQRGQQLSPWLANGHLLPVFFSSPHRKSPTSRPSPNPVTSQQPTSKSHYTQEDMSQSTRNSS